MTEEQIALARRAVACRGWRWMPGMKLTTGLRITESLVPFTFSVDLPDFQDPATLGCLLALVREAWGSNQCFVRCDPSWFVLCRTPPAQAAKIGHGWSGPFTGATEAEALVAALEAAP
jgi:hypothetical protein